MKYLLRALSAIALLFFATAAHAQGTVPLALSQQFDGNGKPLSGALLYTYVVGTVAQPQTTYQDTALTIANQWPLVADNNGRLPMFYLANGSTHIRLTDSTGLVQVDNPNILVVGPSGGGGGAGGTDPTTLMATGDLKVRYGTGPLSGFVRANGLTMGNAVSGATERANADTQALFIYLYNADANLAVSGGRTGNALNDFNNGKTITLPDWRGRTLGALADMGNSATGVLTSTYAGCTPTTLGAACGSQSHTQSLAEMPAHSHSINDPGHVHGVSAPNNGGSAASPGTAVAGNASIAQTASAGTGITINSAGSGNPFTIVQPSMLATFYIKL